VGETVSTVEGETLVVSTMFDTEDTSHSITECISIAPASLGPVGIVYIPVSGSKLLMAMCTNC